MLLWINGPFGGGKTQTAFELQRRLRGAVVSDPEHAGFGLHRMVPRELRGDFQDYAAWRSGVHEVLDLVLRKHDGPVIAPMTVVRVDYLEQLVGRLRADGHEVHHFTLLAERETVLGRLKERGWGRGIKWESSAVRRLDDCLERLAAPEFAEHIHTDHVPVAAVAERIATTVGLPIAPNTDSPLRGRLRRAAVGIRHIRID